LPVRKPGLYAGEVFRSLARSFGIKLPKPVKAKGRIEGKTLVTHYSGSLHDVLKNMLKYSNNMTAEAVGLSASAARGGTGGSLKTSARNMTAWQTTHLNGKRSSFVDHSGLGDHSRLTAGDMVAALVKAGPDGALAKILKPVALRNASGKIVKNHPVKVYAKTGTLNFVSALAGFVTAPDGTRLAFAFFAADEKRRAGVAKSDREAPIGRKRYNRHAKQLQQRLIERWTAIYSA
jgi:D-alanyl-D-alanine carboxypeptidase/D-alanyl-D-alanine-endopeptidase (penicillin-binding protein 4)